MATPASAPVKRAPRKAAAKKTASTKTPPKPGEPKFNWREIYPTDVELFKFSSDDGFIVCLPKYENPGEGEVFGLMLLNKNEQELLIYVMRQHIREHAIDPEQALLVTFQALQKIKAPGTIETLLTQWPEASGLELGKS